MATSVTLVGDKSDFTLAGELASIVPSEAREHEPHTLLEEGALYGDHWVRFGCGHLGHADFAYCFYGEVWVPSDALLARRDQCEDCRLKQLLSRMARCASCGFVILPGQPVLLYPENKLFVLHPSRKTIRRPQGRGLRGWLRRCAGLVRDDVIGCMRPNCFVSAEFFAGTWGNGEFVPAYGGKTLAETLPTTHEGIVIAVMFSPPSSSSSSES